ncbi:MAG: SIMPL domain-containing protein [Candidatus Pacebacteria bacterium]|nr:SIMPL domain-containing protein [Candidatus Paceibacterota bacterium]
MIESLFRNDEEKSQMGKVLLILGLVIALYFGMRFINEIKTFGTIAVTAQNLNTIDVTGSGDAFAIPNVATIVFSVQQKDSTVHGAQEVINKKVNAVMAFFKSSGIEEKDIRTLNYSANPEYSYPTPCYRDSCPENGKPKFIGYDVTQTMHVKVRDTSKAGSIVDGIGSLGITSIAGPDFTVDDDTLVQAEARKIAIEDAKQKAEVLAKDLGVRLVRVIRFSDAGNLPVPMYAKSEMAMDSMGSPAPTAQLPGGESKYTSNVTITYEIR